MFVLTTTKNLWVHLLYDLIFLGYYILRDIEKSLKVRYLQLWYSLKIIARLVQLSERQTYLYFVVLRGCDFFSSTHPLGGAMGCIHSLSVRICCHMKCISDYSCSLNHLIFFLATRLMDNLILFFVFIWVEQNKVESKKVVIWERMEFFHDTYKVWFKEKEIKRNINRWR